MSGLSAVQPGNPNRIVACDALHPIRAGYKMGKANTAILTARLLPNISILLPYYFIFSKLRMIDTYGVLILSHMVLSLPLIVWIMVGFFSDLPLD